jgi:hypothetical protein
MVETMAKNSLQTQKKDLKLLDHYIGQLFGRQLKKLMTGVGVGGGNVHLCMGDNGAGSLRVRYRTVLHRVYVHEPATP